MGVDCTSSFGLGFVVKLNELYHLIDEPVENLSEYDDIEIMGHIKLPKGIELDYWGNEFSNELTFFVRAENPMNDKESLVDGWDRLETFMTSEGLEKRSIGIIGGGLLW